MRVSPTAGDVSTKRREIDRALSMIPPDASKDVCTRFGIRLRGLRLERHLTQSEVAVNFGIDRSFVSDVERGRKSISLRLLEVLAIGLDVSLSDLLKDL